MHIHRLTADAALASLKTSLAGLARAEAARRLVEFGPNHVEEVRREHLLLGFAREFTHFFAIILWAGAALAFLAEHFDPGQGMARLGFAIVGVIVINGIFSFWQEYKAERAVAALRQLLPQKVKLQREGETLEILATDLVPGDIVLLEEGSLVPADCRLVEAFALRVNTATVTGESLPKAHNTEPSMEESPLFAKNIALAGTAVVSGRARAVVYATGMHTEFGKIAHLTQSVGEPSSPLQREIARLVANVFLCRHPRKSSLSFGLFSNPLILLGKAVELGLILFIVYTLAGNWLFGTAPIGPEAFLLAGFFAALMWALEEARKAWLRSSL
jgi:sodium/potassium-transporting ATPase subunit alpha